MRNHIPGYYKPYSIGIWHVNYIRIWFTNVYDNHQIPMMYDHKPYSMMSYVTMRILIIDTLYGHICHSHRSWFWSWGAWPQTSIHPFIICFDPSNAKFRGVFLLIPWAPKSSIQSHLSGIMFNPQGTLGLHSIKCPKNLTVGEVTNQLSVDVCWFYVVGWIRMFDASILHGSVTICWSKSITWGTPHVWKPTKTIINRIWTTYIHHPAIVVPLCLEPPM